jgi:hypothetical protein
LINKENEENEEKGIHMGILGYLGPLGSVALLIWMALPGVDMMAAATLGLR